MPNVVPVWPAATAQYEALFGNRDAAHELLADAVENGLDHVGWDTLRLGSSPFRSTPRLLRV